MTLVVPHLRPFAPGDRPGTVRLSLRIGPPEIKQGSRPATTHCAPPAVHHPSVRHFPLEVLRRPEVILPASDLRITGHRKLTLDRVGQHGLKPGVRCQVLGTREEQKQVSGTTCCVSGDRKVSGLKCRQAPTRVAEVLRGRSWQNPRKSQCTSECGS